MDTGERESEQEPDAGKTRPDEPPREQIVATTDAGQRLDVVLAQLYPEYSRNRLQQWLKHGHILVDGQTLSARYRVHGGERVQLLGNVVAQELLEAGDTVGQATVVAQAIALDVVFADEDLLVINKPAGLVMHPAAGNPDGTVQNGLLHLNPALAGIPRAGIVHRLDKDTTGLFVVAQSLRAHTALTRQLQERSMKREYCAVVQGELVAGATIDAPLGRHPVDRKRMAVVNGGRAAVTHYRVHTKLRGFTRIDVQLDTGRTHQIRVHMAHIKHPLVGDPVYGGRRRLPANYTETARTAIAAFPRQALHAQRLSLCHPATARPCQWHAPLPHDMLALLDQMEPA